MTFPGSSNASEGPGSPGPSPFETAAVELAARGFHVFPCMPNSKAPLTAHGFKNATRDVDVIRGWWTRTPDANIAIRTGAISGIVVLDIDGDSGADSLAELERQFGELDLTVSVKTPDGVHYYFAHPGGTIPCSAGKIAPGIDVRGDGGYVLAPPSIHPRGIPYVWDEELDP